MTYLLLPRMLEKYVSCVLVSKSILWFYYVTSGNNFIWIFFDMHILVMVMIEAVSSRTLYVMLFGFFFSWSIYRGGGVIVNLSSISDVMIVPFLITYAATKVHTPFLKGRRRGGCGCPLLFKWGRGGSAPSLCTVHPIVLNKNTALVSQNAPQSAINPKNF